MSVISDDLDDVIKYLDTEIRDEFTDVLKNQQEMYGRIKIPMKKISKLLDAHFEARFPRMKSGS
ncbi:MAG: hypothetical protein FK732_01995 [Asgard group archaeon]|nr:hypothetical protein [Asgard group archaeon]